MKGLYFKNKGAKSWHAFIGTRQIIVRKFFSRFSNHMPREYFIQIKDFPPSEIEGIIEITSFFCEPCSEEEFFKAFNEAQNEITNTIWEVLPHTEQKEQQEAK